MGYGQMDNLLTRKSFSELAISYHRKHGISPMDAVIHLCEERMIDPLDVKKLIDPTLKGLIEKEAIDLNMLKECSKSSLEEFL